MRNTVDTPGVDELTGLLHDRYDLTPDQQREFLAEAQNELQRVEDWILAEIPEVGELYHEAQKRTTELAIRESSDLGAVSKEHRRLKRAFGEMTARLDDLPQVAHRVAQGVLYVSGLVGLSIVLLAIGAIALLGIVYVVKSTLGIDLLQGIHLEDLIS
jgi:hypothetical protein